MEVTPGVNPGRSGSKHIYSHRHTYTPVIWHIISVLVVLKNDCIVFSSGTITHITIQRGCDLPPLQQCTSCCSHYHCPFCSPSFYKPRKKYKLKTHLQLHFSRAVVHEGNVIFMPVSVCCFLSFAENLGLLIKL